MKDYSYNTFIKTFKAKELSHYLIIKLSNLHNDI